MSKKISLQQQRIFSDSLKRKLVGDIEKGKATVLQISREYSVSSPSVYRWLNKYSRHLQRGKTLVMQMDSEAYKTKELEKKILELQAALGRKQMEIDFLNEMIAQGKRQLGIDLKKKYCTPPSSTSGSIKDDTDIK